MTKVAVKKKADLVASLARKAKSGGGPKAKAAAHFIEQFYAHVAPEDVAAAGAEDRHGAALSAWSFLQIRKLNEPKIRIFNPDAKKDGWSCGHTVVQIVNDDMPFLVDSVTAELNRHNLTVHLAIHPVIRVRRGKNGQLLELLDPRMDSEGSQPESVMHLEITEQTLPETMEKMERRLATVLGDVRAAVGDWHALRMRVADVIAELDSAPPPIPAPEVQEAKDFLRWVDDNHFTFLGYREYTFEPTKGKTVIRFVPRSGLGILRGDSTTVVEGMGNGDTVPPYIDDFLRKPTLLLISKANQISTVHRAVHMDTIGIKKYDADGNVVGERLFVGLFTSVAYNRAARDIPLLRRKVDTVLSRSGITPTSHDGKALVNILETLPRDELFQVSEDDLLNTSVGILHLQERQRIAMFVHRDPFERFVSCLIYVPRDRYSTRLREEMQQIVETGFGGKVSAFYTQLSESLLARTHFIVTTTPGAKQPVSDEEIEEQLAIVGRDWNDELNHALAEAHGEGKGVSLFRHYARAFPTSYRDSFKAEHAVQDIAKIDAALRTGILHMDVYRPGGDDADEFRLKIFSHYGPVPLSDVLPMLENMGLKVIDEVPHVIEPAHAEAPFYIHDFGLELRSGAAVAIEEVKDKFEDCFAGVWSGDIEDDGFNRLVLVATLDARRITVLRAYCKYLRQIGIPFSQAYMEETLATNPAIARNLVDLFETLFDPANQKDVDKRADKIRKKILDALDAVENLDEDRILRRYLNVIDSTLRTNHYQTGPDGGPKPCLSLKLDSRQIDDLPLPRPMVEVFVYSPRVEAVHLRAGKVARGGIRWSDRREDFRTEILGLMKAQVTKNAVIVPTGAKGGFVVKQPPAENRRELVQAEGIECYKIFMGGLLDISDNLDPKGVAPPEDVVRRDEDDPYLVVAADKGTATFSDIANAISQERGFWLDDAFASGGSAGYDHKAMGITARGAWESVKRHFREIGINTQTTDFTCVGVGDMSGDVFGNGMLNSEHIRLIGAFNHLHIFVDPTPDAAKSYAERQRLFKLPRSGWADYDTKLISKGGGVFERKAKSIKITPEMREAFELPGRQTITPNELIQAMLKAEFDLLWFGGIGTYVKARSESQAEVGDRANDAVRIDGRDLRCKVVGEGANLGVTQLGRIEYASDGGRINTDSIDNSAGVDCSDHEVNIKILLGGVEAEGKLTRKARDKLLTEMTDEVAELVLLDNYRQTMALTHAEALGPALLDEHIRFMRSLERAGRLNRSVEFLPDDDTLTDRRAANRGLTRPELAVLLAYAKLALNEALSESDVPDDPFLTKDVGLYFPTPLRKRFPEAIENHRLKREIVATYMTNSLVNRTGPGFISEMQDKTGMAVGAIARAYLTTRQVFQLRALWAEIEALDNKVAATTQSAMNLDIARLIRRGTQWFLRNGPRPLEITSTIEAFQPGIADLAEEMETLLTGDLKASLAERTADYVAEGVPEGLAGRIAALQVLAAGCDIVATAHTGGFDVIDVGRIHFGLGERFGFNWLRQAADRVPAETEWQKLAIGAIVDEFDSQQTTLATHVLETAGGSSAADGVLEAWASAHSHGVNRLQELVQEFRKIGGVDLSMLTLASRELRTLVNQ